MRRPKHDETEPVEMIEGPNHHNPRFEFPGRDVMTFPPRSDGRRIEWTTKPIAAQLTGPVYNRAGHEPMFRIAEELRSQNLGMDEKVVEIIRRNREEVRAILFPEGVQDILEDHIQGLDPLLPPVDDDANMEPMSLDDMDKQQLLAYARGQRIEVDARWREDKMRERIRQHEQLGKSGD